MNCSECKFSTRHEYWSNMFYCHNPDCPNFTQNLNCSHCEYGVAEDSSASPTSIFTEPQIELYSVVCKIDTGVNYINKEYLVNATSQERALELVTEYFKNTSHSDEAIVGEPTVHVLRKEGIIDSHQVGCY